MRYLSWIGLSLNDVEDAYIAATFTGRCGHHAVLRLQKPAHNIQNRRFPYRLCLFHVIAREWGI